MLRLIFLLLFSYSVNASDPTFTVGTDPIDITNTGTGLSLGDDQMSGMKDIGFDFTFYDQTFDQVNISMNGFYVPVKFFCTLEVGNYLSRNITSKFVQLQRLSCME